MDLGRGGARVMASRVSVSFRLLEIEIVDGRVTHHRLEGVSVQQFPSRALGRACPRCAAGPGERCRSASGLPASCTHAARSAP